MRIACLGGGPAGLYFAISMKVRDPAHEVVVIERNRANDTFGWGVVLSDEVLVFPGHDFHGRTVSTIGEERRRNPYFLARSRDAFVAAFRARQQEALARPAFVGAAPLHH